LGFGGLRPAKKAACQHCPRRSHAILADTVGITLQGQLNITAKFEAGLDEVKNSVGMNHALAKPPPGRIQLWYLKPNLQQHSLRLLPDWMRGRQQQEFPRHWLLFSAQGCTNVATALITVPACKMLILNEVSSRNPRFPTLNFVSKK
jgi:hypothetical protein